MDLDTCVSSWLRPGDVAEERKLALKVLWDLQHDPFVGYSLKVGQSDPESTRILLAVGLALAP